MWVASRLHHQIRPVIISHGYDPSRDSDSPPKLLSNMIWDGCRNYTSLLTVPSVINWWKAFGEENAREYSRSLLQQAVLVMMHEWQLHESDMPIPAAMRQYSPMCLVPLPAKLLGRSTVGDVSDADAFELQEYLHHAHLIEVPVKCLEKRLYIRLSSHIHNELDDYLKLTHVIKQLMLGNM